MQLPLLATGGEVLALRLQFLAFVLVEAGLALQFTAAGVEASQFRLNRQQLVFPKGLHLLLEQLQFGHGLVQLLSAAGDGRGVPLFLGFQRLLARGQILEGLLGGFVGQHHLLAASQLQPFPQVLVLPGLGAVLLQPLAAGQQFLLNDPAALLALLHVIELAAGLFDPGVEQGNTGQFIDQAAAVAVAHRDDAGDVPLHHHVAALGINPKAAQLGLQLLQVAGHPVGAVAGAVGAPWHHPQFAGHRPFRLSRLNPGPLRWCLQAFLGGIGCPVAQVKADADGCFSGLAGLEHAAVDQVRQAVSPHATTGGQAQAEQNAIKDVAFAGAIGSGHDGESLFKRDRHRSAERLEVRQPNLIDMNQQDLGLSASRN